MTCTYHFSKKKVVTDLWQWHYWNKREKNLLQLVCGNGIAKIVGKKNLWEWICDNGIIKIGEKKNCYNWFVAIALSIMEKKKSLIFGNRIAEKIATSIVHCQTFELSRTQLDPSPDMNNYTFKKKRYPFWIVCVYGGVCFKCLMTYDLTIISAISLSKIKLFFFTISVMSLPQIKCNNFFPNYFGNAIATNQWPLFFWEMIYAYHFYNIFRTNLKW